MHDHTELVGVSVPITTDALDRNWHAVIDRGVPPLEAKKVIAPSQADELVSMYMQVIVRSTDEQHWMLEHFKGLNQNGYGKLKRVVLYSLPTRPAMRSACRILSKPI